VLPDVATQAVLRRAAAQACSGMWAHRALRATKHGLGDGLPIGDRIIERLNAFALQAMGVPRGFFGAFCSLPILDIRARFLRLLAPEGEPGHLEI
jgi:hypothetical protein